MSGEVCEHGKSVFSFCKECCREVVQKGNNYASLDISIAGAFERSKVMPLGYRENFEVAAQQVKTQEDIDWLCLERLTVSAENCGEFSEGVLKDLLGVVAKLLDIKQ